MIRDLFSMLGQDISAFFGIELPWQRGGHVVLLDQHLQFMDVLVEGKSIAD